MTANETEIRSAWPEIRDSIREIHELVRSDLAPGEFHNELLRRIHAALGSRFARIWVVTAGGNLQLAHEMGRRELAVENGADEQRQRRALLEQALQSGREIVVPPGTNAQHNGAPSNPSDCLLVIFPIVVDSAPVGVIELGQDTGARMAERGNVVRFLAEIAELVGEYHRRRELQRLRERATAWSDLDRFGRRVHQSLDLKRIGYEIVNEGRLYLGCDRLSLAVCRGRSCRILAMSGLDSTHRRANSVRLIERLATSVVRVGEPCLYPARDHDLTPQVEKAAMLYCDESYAKRLLVILLNEPADEPAEGRRPARYLGVLIAEQFNAEHFGDTFHDRLDAVRDHSALALQKAMEHHRVFLLPVLRVVGSLWELVRHRAPFRSAAVAAFLAALICAALLVPADFALEGRGALQPQVRREIFARADGVVNEVHVQPGDRVRQGAVLAVLDNPQLEFRIAGVEGELQSVRTKLSAIEAAKLGNLSARGRDPARSPFSATDEEELKEWLRSLEQQRELLNARKNDLQICSPIAGQVITWNVEPRLASRPLSVGDVLMTVADLDGPWILEVSMHEDRIGHVLSAQAKLGDDLPVEFVLATDPAIVHHGTIEDVGLTTEMDERDQSIVLVTVRFDRRAIQSPLRPGATVTAKIRCGQKPIGYVWLHDLIEFVQRRVLFKL